MIQPRAELPRLPPATNTVHAVPAYETAGGCKARGLVRGFRALLYLNSTMLPEAVRCAFMPSNTDCP